MGLSKRFSNQTIEAPTIKEIEFLKKPEQKKPSPEGDMDASMDATEDTRFSRTTSLIADGALDDSMFTSSYVVDDSTKVSGTVEKGENASTKVGISLRKSHALGCVTIAAIKEGGLFSATELKVGQKVLTINGAVCPTEIVAAARLIAKATGSLTIEAADMKQEEDVEEDPVDESMFSSSIVVDNGSKVVGTVDKGGDASTKVGIGLQNSKVADCVIIAAIREGGLFSATELKVGQKVLSINGIECPSEAADAAHLIFEATGGLTIEAADIKQEQILDTNIVEVVSTEQPFDVQSASTVEVVEEEQEDEEEVGKVEEPAPRASLLSSQTVTYAAVATGTVLVGSILARSVSGRR